jgi:hypothetical protein
VKKRNRALALKIVHALDGQTDVRRADIVQQLLADQSRYSAAEVDNMIGRLHKFGLTTRTTVAAQEGIGKIERPVSLDVSSLVLAATPGRASAWSCFLN